MQAERIKELRDVFGGEMTPTERAFLQSVCANAKSALESATTFKAFVDATARGLVEFADHPFDDTASRERRFLFTSDVTDLAEALSGDTWTEAPNALANEDDKRFLSDVLGLLEFATRNGLGFLLIVIVLAHDVVEIVKKGSMTAALKRGFSPKAGGWSQHNTDAVGAPEEPFE